MHTSKSATSMGIFSLNILFVILFTIYKVEGDKKYTFSDLSFANLRKELAELVCLEEKQITGNTNHLWTINHPKTSYLKILFGNQFNF